MLAFVGLQNLSQDIVFAVVTVAVAASILFGWATDAVMRSAGFGIAGNAFLAMLGSVIGARIWIVEVQHGLRAGQADIMPIMMASAACAMLVVIGTATLRAMFMRA